jgi:hypothetical protein
VLIAAKVRRCVMLFSYLQKVSAECWYKKVNIQKIQAKKLVNTTAIILIIRV